jgi:hypothetical protein
LEESSGSLMVTGQSYPRVNRPHRPVLSTVASTWNMLLKVMVFLGDLGCSGGNYKAANISKRGIDRQKRKV